jgi:hypothetical protein
LVRRRHTWQNLVAAHVQELGRAQSHNRDQALGSSLVVPVWRVNRHQARPELRLFFFTHPLRGNKEASTTYRELARGISLEVEIPTWVLRPTTLRCNDDEGVSIDEIQKGHCSRSTGFASPGRQQADGCARGEAAQPSPAAQAVDQDVEGACNAQHTLVHLGQLNRFLAHRGTRKSSQPWSKRQC